MDIIKGLTLRELCETSNKELYEMLVKKSILLEEDIESVKSYIAIREKKRIWQKSPPLPHVNYGYEIAERSIVFSESYIWQLRLSNIYEKINLIHRRLVVGRNIESLPKRMFYELLEDDGLYNENSIEYIKEVINIKNDKVEE